MAIATVSVTYRRHTRVFLMVNEQDDIVAGVVVVVVVVVVFVGAIVLGVVAVAIAVSKPETSCISARPGEGIEQCPSAVAI